MAELSLSQEEIALIEFKTHHQAKRLKISASSTRGLVLTAPKWASLECCTDFLQDNARWIRKQIQALEIVSKENPDLQAQIDLLSKKYQEKENKLYSN